MDRRTIELFLPLSTDSFGQSAAERYISHPAVGSVWLLSSSPVGGVLPENVHVLQTASLTATALFMDIASRATADFVIYSAKAGVEIDMDRLSALLDAVPDDASMVYSHYMKSVDGVVAEAPTIDYHAGSLRNDFDFGSVLLLRSAALKRFVAESPAEYEYAGLYQLRLALSRYGRIHHHCDYLYTECENDTRKSGEKQFDYVNPAQREVQIEMEEVCTHHLKAIGAWLPPCKYREIDLSAGDFPVEASVVIPVLDRHMTIADAVGSVLKQKTTFPFNVIVVDNHSTDGTGEIIDSFGDDRVVHIVPERRDLGIGGCWNEAVNSAHCGRFAVQLDSDDIYSDENTLQRVVDEFYRQQCAMIVGTYRICDFELNTLPPGVIDHREWTEENGRNNALRINGLGAPRAFFTPVVREVGFPNVSYGEDYAVGLAISRNYRLGRIYDVLYLCRRWGGNSDAALSHEKVNAHNLYKDSLRTAELEARLELVKSLGVPSMDELKDFFDKQLAQWPDAAERHAALAGAELRDLGNGLHLQHNPARAVSTGAKVDKESVAARKCFLCAENRPAQQIAGSAMGSIEVLVNPFPILPFHLTLPVKGHHPQRISGMYADMLHIARKWQNLVLFYNGAQCGASAPDHAHLQAGAKAGIPLFGEYWQEEISCGMEPLLVNGDGSLYSVTTYAVPLFMISSRNIARSVELCGRLLAALPLHDDEAEPRVNMFAYYDPEEGYVTIVVPRRVHRPSAYFAQGGLQRLVSPGAIDMAGLVIAPRKDDFLAMTADEVMGMLREVAMSPAEVEEVVSRLS
ncbi:MAG: DUF4922 domain-containing protein [Bacteroidaceae bacterium]|nr:DUF4922 domain-containing protein [Bacteroidaceae bacterium]